MAAPLCRYCGGPIAKKSFTVYVRAGKERQSHESDGNFYRYVYPETPPTTLADCKTLTNDHVMSVRRSDDNSAISRFTTWDGASYQDPYFCNGNHARAFAYLMAKNGRSTVDYNDALAAQAEAAKS